MKKRRVLYITGTRADYGLMRSTLRAINNSPFLDLEVVATGMHLMPEFGHTIDEVKKDAFKVHQIPAVYQKDDQASMAMFLGVFIQNLIEHIARIKPDIILLLGDRAEMLGAAAVGAYLGIPVAHIHGGDVSSTVDDSVRHAITKLSSIHFPATKKSAERIIKLGEDPKKVRVVGAPGLDEILSSPLISKPEIAKKYGLDFSLPSVLVVQHPVTAEIKDAAFQIEQTMAAVRDLGYQAIVIYPNADAGGRKMIDVIERYRKYPFIKIYKNIPRLDYLSLLATVSAMVGNSSSGIIETPSFHLPVVNIGSRQQGREEGGNTIKTSYNKEEIKKAIQKAINSRQFIKKVSRAKSPYGDGKTGQRIAKLLAQIKIDKNLLEKKITY